ncbi:hypothetical protein BGZ72_009313 [Mortierella alpina]|nr:hypothetical protein BGZ72_009313 [Mortierella alpina]
MHTPSADAAQRLTQAVLLAWLCHRYHDLATYASESLKQRIHFLARPDGSNLQDLFIWDPPSSSLTALSWSSAQILDYIHRHWSPDQSPLNPPHPTSSWDAVPVYCKELDQETLHAIVPIGQQDDHATVAVVLAAESAPEGDNASCWRYHNIVVINECELHSDGWHRFSEFMTLKDPSPTDSSSAALEIQEDQANNRSEAAEDQDSDDDYWGQYSDSEDDSLASEETDQPRTADKMATADREEDEEEKDEDEDEYWRKYAEQQEQQDRDERKKKMQEPPAQSLGTTTTTTRDLEDLLSPTIHQSSTTDPNATSSSSSSIAPTRPGQLDPTMLSSLMQMLVAQSMDTSPPPLPPPSAPMAQQSLSTLDVSQNDSSDQSSKSSIMDSLRSIVHDCNQAGFSKDEVFEMLQTVYNTSSC